MEIPQFDAAAFATDFNANAAVNVTEIRNVTPQEYPFGHVEFDGTFDVPHNRARYVAVGSSSVMPKAMFSDTQAHTRFFDTFRGFVCTHTYISPRVNFACAEGAWKSFQESYPLDRRRSYDDHKAGATVLESGSALINPGPEYPETHIGTAFILGINAVAVVINVGDGVILRPNIRISAASIGDNTHIGSGVSIGMPIYPDMRWLSRPMQMQPFGESKVGGIVRIQEGVQIGRSVTIGNRVYVGGDTVGDDVTLEDDFQHHKHGYRSNIDNFWDEPVKINGVLYRSAPPNIPNGTTGKRTYLKYVNNQKHEVSSWIQDYTVPQ